jgi:hypothetical protein
MSSRDRAELLGQVEVLRAQTDELRRRSRETFARAADALEASAKLAGYDAEKNERRGQVESAARERDIACRTRTAALPARTNAARL